MNASWYFLEGGKKKHGIFQPERSVTEPRFEPETCVLLYAETANSLLQLIEHNETGIKAQTRRRNGQHIVVCP
jgi:hypothetical protein